MKRLVREILILIVILVFGFEVRSYAEESKSGEFITSGDYRYVLLDDGNAEIVAYLGREESVIVPGSLDDYVVTSIGDSAFSYCVSLSSITLPDSVTSIGDSAFYDCSSLSSITLPDSLTSIGDSAFSVCSSLSSITLPDSLTSIGDSAFSDCSSLSSIALPDSVVNIGGNPFPFCEKLEGVTVSLNNPAFAVIEGLLYYKPEKRLVYCPMYKETVVIPQGIQIIGDRAFSGCASLSSITLPDSVTSIGDYAFFYCSRLNSITLPDSVTSIGAYAFFYCSNLNSITLPDSLTSIGETAFYHCDSLSSITLPDSVVNIGGNPFPDCEKLEGVTVSLNNPAFAVIDGLLYYKPEKRLVYCPVYKETVVIPQGIQIIGDRAFSGCASLSSITLPDSVTSIGDFAFSGCSSLSSITLPDSVVSIGNQVFSYCSSLNSIKLPDNVVSIGNWAFSYCSSLTSITLPDSVTSIGYFAFYNCASLTSITLPGGLTSIANEAFSGCSDLTNITVPEGSYAEEYCRENGFDYQYSTLTAETVPAVTGDFLSVSNGLNYYTFPDGSTIVLSCQNEIDMPVHLFIPDQVNGFPVTGIAEGAFAGCSKLKSVTISQSMKEIKDGAFRGCSNLTDVYYTGTRAQWSGITGSGKEELNAVHLYCSDDKSDSGTCGPDLSWVLYPSGMLLITGTGPMDDYGSAEAPWYGNQNILKTVVIGDGVTTIGTNAFYLVHKMTSVTIPESLVSIGTGAFRHSAVLEDVYYGGSKKWWDKNVQVEDYNQIIFQAVRHYASYTRTEPLSEVWWAYPNTEFEGDFGHYGYYSDSFFDESSWVYDHQRTRMSLCLAMAAFNSSEGSFRDPASVKDYNYGYESLLDSPAKNIIKLMDECGFSKDTIMVNRDYLIDTQYDKVYNDGNNVGICIASKKLEKDLTLIAVAIRGGGYGDEWIGNFEIYGSNTVHIGFEKGKKKVLQALESYVSANGISGDVKVWMVGYSRAGAICNLAAASLCQDGLLGCNLTPKNVYAHTFEAPMGTKDIGKDIYNGIWNIINPIDPVPMVALKWWGYTRYGNTLMVPSKETDSETYKQYEKKVISRFKEYIGKDYFIDSIQLPEQESILDFILSMVDDILVDENSDRTKLLQESIIKYFKLSTPKTNKDEYSILEAVKAFKSAMDYIEDPWDAGLSDAAKAALNEGLNILIISHYPELALAWLDVIDEADLKPVP